MRSAIEEFKGGRLQKALDARMLSVSALSDISTISSSMLYYLLNDEKKPSHETLQIISNTLNLPTAYFTKEESTDIAHEFFRSYKRTNKDLRLSVKVKLQWVSEIQSFLNQYVKFPKLNLPKFEELKGRDPRTISSEEVENFAQRTRAYWGLSNGVITNTTLLFENNGLFLTKFEVGNEDVDALSRINLKTKNAFILLATDKDSRSRSKFDNAHELGHVILHSSINTKKINFEKKEIHDLLEEQANRFAGAFLLPEISFSRDFTYPTLESFKILKTKWKVSIGLLVFRARQLGLINDRTYKNIQINISKKGWRKKEPLEELIELETPTLARQAFKLIFDEKLVSVKEMENAIGLSQNEIEKISGLEPKFFDKYKMENDRPKLRLVK